jgi:hypothetical protein
MPGKSTMVIETTEKDGQTKKNQAQEQRKVTPLQLLLVQDQVQANNHKPTPDHKLETDKL